MTVADISRGTRWGGSSDWKNALYDFLGGDVVAPEEAAEVPVGPLCFPALANQLAFKGKFNAKRVAVGMGATMGKHRGL